MAVFDLEEQLINNDTELGVLFSERKNSRERIIFGSSDKYSRQLFNQSSAQTERNYTRKAP
jgi:hypothetical protein